MATENFWKIKKKLTFTDICVEIRRLGSDYHILVSGGECPHVGCTVLAVPRPSLDGSGRMSSTASVLNVTGHKDEEVCRYLAEKVSAGKKTTVVCTGGIHMDGITKEQIADNIKSFEELLGSVNREGMDRLLEFIRKSDFYKAPASTRFHSSCEGGLLYHSLQVYYCLQRKKAEAQVIWADTMQKIDDESLILVALLHDLCKTYYYTVEMRNKKDDSGRWVQVPFYTVNDKVPYGHGEKSVMMIEEYIKLKPVERYAIRWHMGFSEPKELYGTLGEAIKKYPLCLAVHEADVEATYLMESDGE